jgi:hypothetical protein
LLILSPRVDLAELVAIVELVDPISFEILFTGRPDEPSRDRLLLIERDALRPITPPISEPEDILRFCTVPEEEFIEITYSPTILQDERK